MARLLATALAAVASIGATACSLSVDYSGTEYACGPAGECPPGFECRGGTCVPEGTPGQDAGVDAGPGAIDAGPDAGVEAACGTTARLVDDFDDGVMGPQWGDFADTGTERLEQDGALVMRVAADAGDMWAGYYSRHAHDLTGHHARVRVTQVGPLYTVLEVQRPDGAKAQVVEDSGSIVAALYGLPDGNGVLASLPYEPDAHRWWRIREQAGVMYWELSADGTAWQILHQEPNPFPPRNIRVVLAAGGSRAAATEARMDDFNPDGDPAEPWCSISGLRDDFADGEVAEEWADSWETTGCERVETGGAATIAFDGTADQWCGYESFPVYDACNGQVALEIPTPLDAANSEMWLDLYLPDGTISFNVWEGMLRARENSDATSFATSFDYDAAAHRWWRIRADGATTYWETSPDGVAWTERASRPIDLDCSTAFVGFGAGLWNTWTAGATETAFDNFNVSP